MFKQLYIYELKQSLRVKEMMFWNLAFPIILSTIMFLTLSNIDNAVALKSISYSSDDESIVSILNQIELDNEVKMFENVQSDNPEELLKNGDISGIIKRDEDGYSVQIAKDDMKSSVLVNLLNVIKHKWELIGLAFSSEQANANQEEIISTFTKEDNYVQSGLDASSKKGMNGFFYSLLGMVCMGASTMGVVSVCRTIPGGVEDQYVNRLAVSPVKRTKLLMVFLAGSLTIAFLQSLVVIAYMGGVLGIEFGDSLPFLSLGIFFGTILGLLVGMILALILKFKADTIIGINVAVYLFSSFLAGLMSNDLPSKIEMKLPIVSKINPATIISRFFSSLYYYDDPDVYMSNLYRVIIAVVVCMVLVLVLARRRENDRI